ncbi:MAG: HNH endonuclease [Verrucomicrobiota bacterium]
MQRRFCQMCGSTSNNFWMTRPSRRVVLCVRPRAGDVAHNWTVCDECHEGMRSLALNPSRKVRLTGHIADKSKGGKDEPSNLRAVCANCNEGLQNTAPQTPDRIHLLSQIRRATIDDQKAVLEWLNTKFGIK